jgi:hypothetical protein
MQFQKRVFYLLIGIGIMFLMSEYAVAQNIMISSASVKSVKVIAPHKDEIKPLADYLRYFLALNTNIVDEQVHHRM